MNATTLRWPRPLALALALSSAVASIDARADAPSGDLVPPRLVESAEPSVPEDAPGRMDPVKVMLRLTVDASGAVTVIEVTSSGGEVLDAASVAAARRLVFAPATRNGTPIASRIPFSFEFAPNLSPLPPPTAKPEDELLGDRTTTAEGGVVDTTSSVEVRGERSEREVTRRVLETRELVRIPGTNGDAVRAVENLPGVARPPGFAGLLIVRGSGPADTAVFVDGTGIPLAFHFGGASSVIPSEMISRIDFLPGSFGPEYGRALGGVVDIGVRSPTRDRFHGLAQVDLLDARLLAEAPLGKSTRFLVAGRRSHVDAWIGSALEATGALGVSTAPVYYDYQVVLEQDLGTSTTARLLFHGSDDRIALTLNAPSGDPATGGRIREHTRFYRIQARTETRLGEGTRWNNTLAFGEDSQQAGVGSFYLDVRSRPLHLRSDLRHVVAPFLTLVAGVDARFTSANVAVDATPIPDDAQDQGPLFGRPRRRQALEATLFQPGAYGMMELAPAKGLRILSSLRGDYSDDIDEWRASPRLVARFDVVSAPLRTTLKGGTGLYLQPPQPHQSLRPFGTPNLRHEQAEHYSAGVEQEITRQLALSVEGFYKHLEDLVVSRPDAMRSASGVSYSNTGSGRVYGAELLLRYRPDDRFFGWIAYTLSRSERRDDPSEAYRLFEYDQTHILAAIASYKIGGGWEVGARFRYVSGRPYTPAVGGIYDADAGVYGPVEGARFSERIGAFHRLDLRVDKTWSFRSWKLAAYLDVQNAYFRQNPEGRRYNFNYSRSDVIAGLPFLPIIGLRGEL